ncbi:uncharacterized protein PRCAT00005329001 [Priceomyces carsonii]|uniref:uncharacterized protein n=1 Tax=Priceomyces carsonii TaxID=28549 RepID=UPI002EDAEFA1|nr:unnamed protein product [Priceomyces carsonii]
MNVPIEYVIAALLLFSIVVLLCVKCIKVLNNMLLYGKTYSNKRKVDLKLYKRIDDTIVSLTVPKAYFTHFYVIFFLLCCLSQWFLSLVYFDSKRSVYMNFSVQEIPGVEEFKNYQVILYLLSAQSIRRLLECLFITNFSKTSRMNILHYVMGMLFYSLVSLNSFMSLLPYYLSDSDKKIPLKLNLADYLLLLMFLVVSIKQNEQHRYLAGLKKYSLPDFALLASPHYLNEILIYFIVFLFSARLKRFTIIELNFLLAWVFVLTNLLISSLETFKYYKKTYDKEFKVKWAVIPGLL